MSWRIAELLVLVPPFGVLGRAQQQLEMNCLHCIAGRILKFMVKLLLIMCCSCCAASLMRTAAAKVNNIESYTKLSHEEMHHINTLHPTSSNFSFHPFQPSPHQFHHPRRPSIACASMLVPLLLPLFACLFDVRSPQRWEFLLHL